MQFNYLHIVTVCQSLHLHAAILQFVFKFVLPEIANNSVTTLSTLKYVFPNAQMKSSKRKSGNDSYNSVLKLSLTFSYPFSSTSIKQFATFPLGFPELSNG